MHKVITKGIAEVATKNALNKRKEEVLAAKELFMSTLISMVRSKTPTVVLNLEEHYSEYLNTSNKITISGNGFGIETFNSKSLVVTDGEYFEPNEEQGAVLVNLNRRYLDLNKNLAEYSLKMYNTFLSLRTYRRAQEDFPELYQFLPPIKVSENLQLALTKKDILEMIK